SHERLCCRLMYDLRPRGERGRLGLSASGGREAAREFGMPRKLFRLGVYALAIYRGQVILVRKGGGPYVGRWDLPGGGVEFGEAPLETLARELQEETGLAFAEAELYDVASLC